MLNTKSRKLKVSVKLNNSCFYIGENQFCFVDEKLSSGFFKCRIFRLDLQKDLYTQPIQSKTFQIFFIPSIDEIGVMESLCRKVVVLPWKGGLACFPLLHEIEH